MSDNELEEIIKEHKFYHNIKLSDKFTANGYKFMIPLQDFILDYLRTMNIKGKKLLDIGCRDGLFSFELEKLNALEVVGIDNDMPEYFNNVIVKSLNSKVNFKQINLYNLEPSTFGVFDLIIFPGVLYHLRYPFWGLKTIRNLLKDGGELLIETPIWDGCHNNAILFCPTGPDSPYEATSCTFFNEKGLIDTVKSLGFEVVKIKYFHNTGIGKLKNNIRRIISRLKICLLFGSTPKIKFVRRALFHLKYNHQTEIKSIKQYWENEHDYHSKHKGVLPNTNGFYERFD